jgi:hypothetical protein
LPKHLTTWKSIARFLDVSKNTAKKMAKKGMPTYREGQEVFALAEELTKWRVSKATQIPTNVTPPENNACQEPNQAEK